MFDGFKQILFVKFCSYFMGFFLGILMGSKLRWHNQNLCFFSLYVHIISFSPLNTDGRKVNHSNKFSPMSLKWVKDHIHFRLFFCSFLDTSRILESYLFRSCSFRVGSPNVLLFQPFRLICIKVPFPQSHPFKASTLYLLNGLLNSLFG